MARRWLGDGRSTADRCASPCTRSPRTPAPPRWLRVIGTRVYLEGETAEFKSDLRKFAEHVYLVTAEAVTAHDQLNVHLRFMSTQGDAILLQG